MSNCSISLLLCLLTVLPLWAQGRNDSRNAQSQKKEKKKTEIYYPLYNGVSVGVDLWGLGGKLFGSDFLSSEVSVDVNLKNRYFPIVEIGYGKTDAWSDEGIHYKSSAPYFRVGMDYNTMFNKKHGNMLLAGLRIGSSSFKYDIASMGPDDPVYGYAASDTNLEDVWWKEFTSYDHKGMKGSMKWAELCFGLRAHIYKSLYMGWSLRFKFKLSASPDTYGDPYYVPGFGKYGSNTMGITYTITYKLPY